MAYRIFISHSSKDRDWVESISAVAKAAGVQTYLFEHDPQPGRLLRDKLESAIERSDALVVLLTTHAASSEMVQQEIGLARGMRKPLIPLVENGVSPTSLGMLLGVEHIPFDKENPHRALGDLATELAKRRERSDLQDAATILALALIVALLIGSS